MKTVCEPAYVAKLRELESKFVVDSLLHGQVIPDPPTAFLAFGLHERLARHSCAVSIQKGIRSVPEDMDEKHADSLVAYGRLRRASGEDSDVRAALAWIGPRYGVFSRMLNQKHPTIIFERVREFFEKIKAPCFERPFGNDDYMTLADEIDLKVGHSFTRYHSDRLRSLYPSPFASAAICVNGLVQSRLLATHGYAYSMSLPILALEDWQHVFLEMFSSLKKEHLSLYGQVQAAVGSDKTLRTLLGRQIGCLTRLLGFEPLNPLRLLKGLPDPNKDFDEAVTVRGQVDEKILAIRKQVERLRRLVDNIQHSCLAGDATGAADRVHELRSADPTRSMNHIILDELKEFSSKKLIGKLDQQLDKEVRRKEDIMWLSRYFGSVAFVISGLTLAASHLGLTERLTRDLETLRPVGFGSAAAALILKSAIRIFPGFDIYLAFHKWPKAA